jgi:phosphate starvation-inducible PhoH-like protein
MRSTVVRARAPLAARAIAARHEPHARTATYNHQRYAELVGDVRHGVVVAVGPAGTGKTYIACGAAVSKLLKKQVSKVVLTRPAVCPQGEAHGFLPGDLGAKMRPYMMPLFDALKEHGVGPAAIEMMVRDGRIEVCPFAFMRGRTFHNCYVIADEAQNATPEQVRMLLTRAGEGCKIVLAGDVTQCDLPGAAASSGLSDLLERVERLFEITDETCIDVVMFTEADVMRSELARKMVNMYNP